MNTVNPIYNSAIAQIFGPGIVRRIGDPILENDISQLLVVAGIIPAKNNLLLSEKLALAYNYLKENYRCEYIYKNEIANQILLKYHSDNSATLLREVFSERSIADVVIVNGHTTAYEIKTELDNFDRLDIQLQSYQNLYDFLYIVTHQAAISSLKVRVPNHIGLIVLNKTGKLRTIRRATIISDTFKPSIAVLSLRLTELITAHKKWSGSLPTMGTALIHRYCIDWFLNLTHNDAKAIFAESLKSRRPSNDQFKLISKCNPALRMLFLGTALSKKYCSTAKETLEIFD